MARGFNYAPGASEEVELAQSLELARPQLQTLAQSRNVVVREGIARRRDLALGQMVTLAHDRSADVRAALAANPRASGPVLEHLAGDRHAPVLAALVGNPATPVEVIERLAFHRRGEVRLAAVRRMDGADDRSESVAHSPAPQDASAVPESHAPVEPEVRASVVDISTGRPVPPDCTARPAPEPNASAAPENSAEVRVFRPGPR